MAKKGPKGTSRKRKVERKANVSLKMAEAQVFQSLLKDHPEWAGRNGNCTQCVVEEYNLAEPLYYPEDAK